MRLNKLYPSTSKYLKASDCDDRDLTLTIQSISIERFGSDEKPVLWFREDARGLVMNKTNATVISKLFGSDETDDWVGRKITIYGTEVEYQGEMTPTLRVRSQLPPKPRAAAPAPAPARSPAQPVRDDDPEGEIAF